MDYIPKPPVQPEPPKPKYILVNDIASEKLGPVMRGPFFLTDSKGNKFKVPYMPNVKCKTCKGRGYIGINSKTNQVIGCHKCYNINH